MFNSFMGMSLNPEITVEAASIDAPIGAGVGAAITMESLYANTDTTIAQVNMENLISNLYYKESQGATFESTEVAGLLEAAGGNVVQRVKSAIQKLWAKVKGFFKNIRRSLDAMFMSTSDFVNKYKSQLENLSLSGMKHKVYTFTNLDVNIADHYTKIDQTISDVEATDETASDNIKTHLDNFRGRLVNVSSVESSDFGEELFKFFHNNAESASDKKEENINIHTVIANVKANSKRSENINKAEKAMNKFFADALKQLSKEEKAFNVDASKEGAEKSQASIKATNATRVQTKVSSTQAVMNTYISAWRSAVTENDKQNKELISAALKYKKKSTDLD